MSSDRTLEGAWHYQVAACKEKKVGTTIKVGDGEFHLDETIEELKCPCGAPSRSVALILTPAQNARIGACSVECMVEALQKTAVAAPSRYPRS